MGPDRSKFPKSEVLAGMKNVYEVLRQKELELSRLEKEVEALRLAAPLLWEDGEAEDDSHPTLQPAANDSPRVKKYWP
jgi:hypothetical protein